MMKIRWGTTRGAVHEKVIDFGRVEALGGNGSGTYLVWRNPKDIALLVIPGSSLLDAEEVAE